MIQLFQIHFPQEELDHLKVRLNQTRWPDDPEDAGWSMGTDLHYLRELTDYWKTQYDWRTHETQLNELPHFKTLVDDTWIHFVHVKSPKRNAIPLLLVHGWPDGFYRYHKVIPLLSGDFDLIVPSIPGFGFSDRRTTTPIKVAELFDKLMTQILGYTHFAACGGDIGTGIVSEISNRYPDVVRAIFLTDAGYPTGKEDPASLSEAERQFIRSTQSWVGSEGAYLRLQATKPQTLAYSLNDSPVGFAAWIISMIHSGAGDVGVEKAFGGKDELLTNLMIYWLTGTAGSAARMYWLTATMNQEKEAASALAKKGTVPAGIALFPREIQFPREWAERNFHVQSFKRMLYGGHFGVLEAPELYANELKSFIEQYYNA
ncbi:epoxide hydrolase family protein [Cohnella soli]|uniref:Epoxide hydrolase family protein n=1 Tax=Cohnella soli TaxID=425005 RepID=A0ABW0I243_9BACL